MLDLIRAVKRRVREALSDPREKRHSLVGPPDLWKMKRDFQIQFLKASGLQPHHYLMDVGCGTLRGGVPLIDYLDVGHYYGIEARPEVLEEGRKELAGAHLENKQPVLVSAELSEINFDVQFDFAWAFSVLIHMDDQVLDTALAMIARHLAEDGAFFANVNFGEQKEKEWQGFPLVWRSAEFYRERCEANGLKVELVGTLGELGHNSGREAQDAQQMLRISRA